MTKAKGSFRMTKSEGLLQNDKGEGLSFPVILTLTLNEVKGKGKDLRV
jgi:hypothetical protein